MKCTVLKVFKIALSPSKQVMHKKGDIIEVPENRVKEWSDAGFIKAGKMKIEAPEIKTEQKVVKDLETTVVEDLETAVVDIDEMDKNELEKYARSNFNVELDKRRGLKKLRAQVQELMG
jgi:hypothetical protein